MKAPTGSKMLGRHAVTIRNFLPAVIVTASVLLIIDHWDQFNAREFALLVIIAVAVGLDVFIRMTDAFLSVDQDVGGTMAKAKTLEKPPLDEGVDHGQYG